MKKALSYTGWILFGLAFAGMIYFAWPKEKLIDFRGYAEEISFSEADGCTYIKAAPLEGGTATVQVGPRVSVKEYGGRKIPARDIRPGDMIDLDIKGKWEDGKPITAKWVSVVRGAKLPAALEE